MVPLAPIAFFQRGARNFFACLEREFFKILNIFRLHGILAPTWKNPVSAPDGIIPFFRTNKGFILSLALQALVKKKVEKNPEAIVERKGLMAKGVA